MAAMATFLAPSCSRAVTSLSTFHDQKGGVLKWRSAPVKVSSNRTCGSKQTLQNVQPSLRVSLEVQRRSIVRCQAAEEEEPTVDNSTVLVVGGGGIGMETVKALSTAGSWVTVYQRGEKFRKEVEGLGAMLAIGDAMDPAAIEKTFKSNTFDAVVVSVGGGTAQPEVDKDGPINFMAAAKKAGVKRFIMVSSIGVGESKAAIDAKTYGVLEKVLIAKAAAEEYLTTSGLEYTIIRPGGLLSGAPPSGKGVLTEDPTVAGLISRTDVATLIFKILFDKRTISKTYSAVDIEKVFPGRPTEDFETLSLA
ncbi:unnamed protein product [Calypogeia fissa]